MLNSQIKFAPAKNNHKIKDKANIAIEETSQMLDA